MAGALAERDFAEKLGRAGFTDVTVVQRSPYGVEDAAMYPLFTRDLLDLMRRLIPLNRQGHIGASVVITALRSVG